MHRAVCARAHAARNNGKISREKTFLAFPGPSAKIFFYEVAHALTTQHGLAVSQRIRINKASFNICSSKVVEGITVAIWVWFPLIRRRGFRFVSRTCIQPQ